MKIFDKTKCKLGEGPFWHHSSGTFWFDILSSKMFHKKTLINNPSCTNSIEWYQRGWVNKNVLLIASETNLFLYDLNTRVKNLIDLEKTILKHDQTMEGLTPGAVLDWTMGKIVNQMLGLFIDILK